MRKTTKKDTLKREPICISKADFVALMGCGNSTCEKIIEAAHAQIKVGKRCLVKLDLVERYLNQIAF